MVSLLDAVLDLSRVSLDEKARLVATFFSIADANYNCAACHLKTSAKVRDERKACNTPAEKPVASYHGVFDFHRCPGAFRDESAARIIMMHGLFDRGVLPYSGGVLEQPARFMAFMDFVTTLKAEHFSDLKKKAEADRKRAERGGRKQGLSRANR